MTDDLYERYKEALRIGHVAVLRGALQDAADAYRLASSIAPSRALPHTSLGGVLLRLGHLDDALVEYASAVARAPHDEGALLGQAEALTTAGQRVDAAMALDHVSEIQEASGRLPEAADTLRRALELEEAPERVRRQRTLLRDIRLSAGDHAAEQLLARALRLRDEPSSIIDTPRTAVASVPVTGSAVAIHRVMPEPPAETAVETSAETLAETPTEVLPVTTGVPSESPVETSLEMAAETPAEAPSETAVETAAETPAETLAETAVEWPIVEPVESEYERKRSVLDWPEEDTAAEATRWREPAMASKSMEPEVTAEPVAEPQLAAEVEPEVAAEPIAESGPVAESEREPAPIAPASLPPELAAIVAAVARHEPPAIGVMDGALDTPIGLAAGVVSEPHRQPSGDELLVAAEAADRAGDSTTLRSLLLWTARAYAREGRFEAGLDATHRLLQRTPSDVDAHLVLVDLYVARNWNSLAAEKLALLGRLAELNNDEATRLRLVAVASRVFPKDRRLESLYR